MRIAESIKSRVIIPFRLFPKEGLTSEKFAFSVIVGIVSGVFPVIGMTTVISLFLTMLFRQNLLVVQSVQWLLALIQILLIIPFMQLGAFILNQQALHINMELIKTAFQPGFIQGIQSLGMLLVYGIFAWLILVIPAGVASYYTFLFFLNKTKKAEPVNR